MWVKFLVFYVNEGNGAASNTNTYCSPYCRKYAWPTLIKNLFDESASNAGNPSLIPESGRSPGTGTGNPPHYSCLENSMDSLMGYSPWGCKGSDTT